MQPRMLFFIFILGLTSCSVYKSQGRKNFETRAEQNIPGISAKTARGPEETSSFLKSAQDAKADFILVDVNIFGLQLFQSTSATLAKHWLIVDLQHNSWQIDTDLESETQDQLLKNFHLLTNLGPE